MDTGREMTAGEVAVGTSFNPSADPKVTELKALFAKAFDIVEQSIPEANGSIENARQRKMRDLALGAILTAQMWAVKIATLKY